MSGTGTPEPGPRPEPDEEDVPAPTWARLVLAAAPFVLAALIYLAFRAFGG